MNPSLPKFGVYQSDGDHSVCPLYEARQIIDVKTLIIRMDNLLLF